MYNITANIEEKVCNFLCTRSAIKFFKNMACDKFSFPGDTNSYFLNKIAMNCRLLEDI